MISIHEVFITEDIKSIDDINDPERMNLNAYLLDHYSMAFNDVHSEIFNEVLQNAIMHSTKSIDIPIHIVKIVKNNKDFYKDAVIFQEV